MAIRLIRWASTSCISRAIRARSLNCALLDAQRLLGLRPLGPVAQRPEQLAARADVHAAHDHRDGGQRARGCSRSTRGRSRTGLHQGHRRRRHHAQRRITTICQITLRVASDTVASVPGPSAVTDTEPSRLVVAADREGPAPTEEGQAPARRARRRGRARTATAPAPTARGADRTTARALNATAPVMRQAATARSAAGCTAPGSDVALAHPTSRRRRGGRAPSLARPLLWSPARDPCGRCADRAAAMRLES